MYVLLLEHEDENVNNNKNKKIIEKMDTNL